MKTFIFNVVWWVLVYFGFIAATSGAISPVHIQYDTYNDAYAAIEESREKYINISEPYQVIDEESGIMVYEVEYSNVSDDPVTNLFNVIAGFVLLIQGIRTGLLILGALFSQSAEPVAYIFIIILD